jgi:serine-type D-Ala-D-Ala carboxypeptidase/endopeptidase (penicillin-binding protein 4)
MIGTPMRAAGLAFFLAASHLTTLAQAPGEPADPRTLQDISLQSQAEWFVAQAGGEWGVMAWSITRGTPLVSINASTPLIPASNNKVPTAIWALDTLGPEHRFPTDLLITGPVENGVLRGDVVIRGSGNPAFGYPPRLGLAAFVEEPMTPLRNMAARLAGMGIRMVEGGVVGDATAFDDDLIGPNWPQDTGAGAAQYAPRVSGLPFQRNMIWVEAIPTPGGGRAEIRMDPPVEVVPVLSTVTTGGSRAIAVRRPHEDTIRVSGSVSGRALHRYGVGVADPALLTADALRTALLEAGIQVRNPSRTGAAPAGAEIVHRHVSMPLGMMIPFLNQNSDNFFAEHLWKAAAREAVGQGSYVRGGPASALHFMHHAGVPAGEMYQFDGSGLSNLSRMSANSLVRALVYAHGQPYSELWHASMAVAADPAGTLNRLYRGTPAAGNLHAKTGYIRSVRTLSGYVTARNGEVIAFSFLYNGGNTNGARTVQEQLGVLLAEYGGS